jgi:hypothetical protein
VRRGFTTAVVSATVVLIVALPACSSGKSSPPTTPLPASTTRVIASTIVRAPTTSLLASTTVASAPTSVLLTTSVAEPTAPVISAEAAVREGLRLFNVATAACTAHPTDCDPATFTAVQGPARVNAYAYFSSLAGEGLHSSPDKRGSYVIIESIEFQDDATALATSCAFDAGIMLGPDGPDGQPTIVNDNKASSRSRFTLYLEDGTWRVGSATLDRLGNGDLCASAD